VPLYCFCSFFAHSRERQWTRSMVLCVGSMADEQRTNEQAAVEFWARARKQNGGKAMDKVDNLVSGVNG